MPDIPVPGGLTGRFGLWYSVFVKRPEVIYEDNSCIVVNKPCGLAVQGGKGITVSLDSMLAEGWPQRPLLVHRLDRDTSGLVLAAKNPKAAAWFSALFTGEGGGRGGEGGGKFPGKGIIRQYTAVCAGTPSPPRGTINCKIEVHGREKDAQTRYRLVSAFGGENGNDFSLLELELETGRMHQIRRHLAVMGNPILGDDKYGDFNLNHRLRKTMKLRFLLLHASRLIVAKTPDGFPLDISAPLPEHFSRFIDERGEIAAAYATHTRT